MDKNFYEPERLCRELINLFNGLNEQKIYSFLLRKGMYRPNTFTKKSFEELKNLNTWEKADKLKQKYKRMWGGPDIPIYIFPSHSSIFDSNQKKNGYTFPDKIFLFINPYDDEKELESLFVHEYHHATRMKKIKKNILNYTLLDSLIMEGLAEHAVLQYAGEKYLSKWTRFYPQRELNFYWENHYQKELNVNINDPLHERFLYGTHFSKPLLGYAVGYFLIERYKENYPFSVKSTIGTPAEQFIKIEN